MSPATMRAPLAAKVAANSWPSPRAAPVIATTLSCTSSIGHPSQKAQAAARGGGLSETSKGGSEHLVGLRIDQMHVVEVGNQRHRLAGLAGNRRIDPAAHLRALNEEIDHCFHAHGLDDIELRVERGPARRQITPLLDDVLGAE